MLVSELYREFFFLIAQNSRGQSTLFFCSLKTYAKEIKTKKESLRQEAAVGSDDENKTEEEDQDKNIWFIKQKGTLLLGQINLISAFKH